MKSLLHKDWAGIFAGINIPRIFLLMIGAVLCPEVNASDSERENAAIKQVFSAMDPSFPALKRGIEQWNSGQSAAAIKTVANYFRTRSTIPLTLNREQQDLDQHITADEIAEGRAYVIDRPYQFSNGDIQWKYNPTQDKKPFNPEWTYQFNRHHHWAVLAKAYQNNPSPRYADAFSKQFYSWFVQCPKPAPNEDVNGVGSTWRTLDCGLRLGNSWPEAFQTFVKAPQFSDRNILLFLSSALTQAKMLKEKKTGGNWLTYEMNGVFIFGILFPEFKESKALRVMAIKALQNAVAFQFYPDGAQFELSPGYHLDALENIILVVKNASDTGHVDEIPADYLALADKAYEFAIRIMTPGGKLPTPNDSGADAAFETTIPQYAQLFPNNPLIAWAAAGRKGTAPNFTSCFLPWSGYCAMRSDWSRTAQYLFFDVGPLGMGHYHQDKLNVSVWAGPEELLFDVSGQYENSDFRNYSVSSKGHNLPVVDGREQFRDPNRQLAPEQWEKVKGKGIPRDVANRLTFAPIDADFTSNAQYDFAQGWFVDETRQYPAKHLRQILFVKPNCFLVVDQLLPYDDKIHFYQDRWHVDTVKQTEFSPKCFTSDRGKQYDLAVIPLLTDHLTVRAVTAQRTPEMLGFRVISPWPQSATTILHERKGRGKQIFLTLLYPYQTQNGIPIKVIRQLDVQAAEIEFTNGERLYVCIPDQAGQQPYFKLIPCQ